jgi:arylsulfatase A-like enzyme
MPSPTLAIVAAIGFFAAAAQASSRKPNIVVIFTDDVGYGDLSIHGCKDISTPHLDALLRKGIRCVNGYVMASICAPSRSALLTGRHPQRLGLTANHQPLPRNERTLGDYFRVLGYRTVCIGKWHQSGESRNFPQASEFAPTKRGFDHFEGGLGHSVNTRPAEVKRDVDKGLAFLREKGEQPRFLYLALGACHTPLADDDASLARVGPNVAEKRRPYAASLIGLDDAIGRFMNGMDDAGLWKDTIVWFVNDNGAKLAEGSSSVPLRDGKYSLYDGGVHVPFAVIWEGRLPARKFEGLICTMDILPTSLTAIGAEVPKDRLLDGIDLWLVLSGKTPPDRDRAIYWHGMVQGGGVGFGVVRQRSWRLLDPNFNSAETKKSATVELYDLATDPGETKNVAAANPDIVRRLSELMVQQRDRLRK